MGLKLMELANEGVSWTGGQAGRQSVLIPWGKHMGLWTSDERHRVLKESAEGFPFERRRIQNWKYASMYERMIASGLRARPKPPTSAPLLASRLISNAVEMVPGWALKAIRSKNVERQKRWWAAVWLNYTGQEGVRFLHENPKWADVASQAWRYGRLHMLHWFVKLGGKAAARKMWPDSTNQGRNIWLKMIRDDRMTLHLWPITIWGLEERGVAPRFDATPGMWFSGDLILSQRRPLWVRRAVGRLVAVEVPDPPDPTDPTERTTALFADPGLFSRPDPVREATAVYQREVLEPVRNKVRKVIDFHDMTKNYNDPRMTVLVRAAEQATSFGQIERLHDEAARLVRRIGMERRAMREASRFKGGLPACDFQGNEYIRALTTTDDLLDEGILMDHCIASYADRAATGDVFLFHIDFPRLDGEIELASIEIDRNGSVRQVRGHKNRAPSTELEHFVVQWVRSERERILAEQATSRKTAS